MSDIPDANKYRSRNVSRTESREGKRYDTPRRHQLMQPRVRRSHGIDWRIRTVWILAAGLVLPLSSTNHWQTATKHDPSFDRHSLSPRTVSENCPSSDGSVLPVLFRARS